MTSHLSLQHWIQLLPYRCQWRSQRGLGWIFSKYLKKRRQCITIHRTTGSRHICFGDFSTTSISPCGEGQGLDGPDDTQVLGNLLSARVIVVSSLRVPGADAPKRTLYLTVPHLPIKIIFITGKWILFMFTSFKWNPQQQSMMPENCYYYCVCSAVWNLFINSHLQCCMHNEMYFLFFLKHTVHATRQSISVFVTVSGIARLFHSMDHIQIDEPLWTNSPLIYGHTDHSVVSMATTETGYTEC